MGKTQKFVDQWQQHSGRNTVAATQWQQHTTHNLISWARSLLLAPGERNEKLAVQW